MASTTIGGADVTTAYYARFSASLVSGVIASLIGGVVMALVMIVAYVTVGHAGFWYALEPVGSFLYGDRMFTNATPAMYASAVAFHLGICAVWGIVFGFAATLLRVDKSWGGSLALGVCIGLASQIVDINLVTPPLMHALWGDNLWLASVPPWLSWIGHVAFGITLVIAPAFFRGLWLRWSGRGDVLYDDPRIR
jgi:hypothetical protein